MLLGRVAAISRLDNLKVLAPRIVKALGGEQCLTRGLCEGYNRRGGTNDLASGIRQAWPLPQWRFGPDLRRRIASEKGQKGAEAARAIERNGNEILMTKSTEERLL